MAENRSFTRYVTDRFYNNFYSAVEAYIGENPDRLDLNIRNVRTVGGVALADMEIKFVSISDLPEMEIEFDVIVEGEIVVGEGDYHYDDFDQCYQWFILRCRGDLALSLDDFKINSIDTYNQKNKMDKPMSDALVPYIYKEDLDKVATDFLRRYYPEALKVPMSLDPLLLAEKMGLDVKLHDITEDLSIFGQVYFHDSEAEIYDSDAEEYISTSVKARTIFVDPKAYFLRNLGAVNNTIVHECVHWDKHRKAFELERLYNSSASKIVLNHPKYVKRDLFGETVLTKYARTHMDECCLVFDLSIRSGVKERYHNECFLNRDETSTISFDVVYGKGYQHATPEKQSELLASVLTEKARIYAELPNCYIASLQKVREWRDITYDELAERILIDARTIRRIMNGETNGSILSLVWICLGLHLPPEISNHIIDKSHHSLNYTNDSHVYYRFAINHLYAKKVEEIRAFLLRQGAET